VSVKQPLVSVCVPTYNGAATIQAAIRSVLDQTLAEFELIVVDDGSNDVTPDLVARFDDPRVKLHRNASNLGPQGNWNRCLALASGRYFKLLPHDDVLHRECLARQVAVLEADPAGAVALVFTARDVIGPDDRVLTRRGYPGAKEGLLDSQQVRRSCVRRGTNLLGEPGAVLFRKSLADRIGDFDATNPYVIDLDYWFRLLAHGSAYYLEMPLASFRVSGSSWSVAIGSRQSADFREFVERMSRLRLSPATWFDSFCGRFTPGLNNLARMAFYRLYLR
jgi:glycosyltransferase involved in cell wall biosynthesis